MESPNRLINDLEFWLVRVSGFSRISDSTIDTYAVARGRQTAEDRAIENIYHDGIDEGSVTVTHTWHYVGGNWYLMDD